MFGAEVGAVTGDGGPFGNGDMFAGQCSDAAGDRRARGHRDGAAGVDADVGRDDDGWGEDQRADRGQTDDEPVRVCRPRVAAVFDGDISLDAHGYSQTMMKIAPLAPSPPLPELPVASSAAPPPAPPPPG